MTRVEQLGLATALPIGIAIGVLDARAEEVQPTVLLYLIAGAVLGTLFLALIPPTIGALGAAWLLGWREALRR
jgi:hypothetical protein